MNWLNNLERKFGRYAIKGLMKYIIILQVIGIVLIYIDSGAYTTYFMLDGASILRGEVWKIVTFLTYPPSTSPIWVIFAFYFYYMIGESIERVWGAFRFNLYMITGVLFHVIGAVLSFLITGLPIPMGTVYLYMSLFFAYAMINPDMQLLFMFIIPIKMKYLAIANGFFFALNIVRGFIPTNDALTQLVMLSNSISALVAILNFLIFFFWIQKGKRSLYAKQAVRKKKFQAEVKKSRPETHYENGAKHKCSVCGRTELDDPTLEFRYCSKCGGNREYCNDHLFTHEHLK